MEIKSKKLQQLSQALSRVRANQPRATLAEARKQAQRGVQRRKGAIE